MWVKLASKLKGAACFCLPNAATEGMLGYIYIYIIIYIIIIISLLWYVWRGEVCIPPQCVKVGGTLWNIFSAFPLCGWCLRGGTPVGRTTAG